MNAIAPATSRTRIAMMILAWVSVIRRVPLRGDATAAAFQPPASTGGGRNRTQPPAPPLTGAVLISETPPARAIRLNPLPRANRRMVHPSAAFTTGADG